METVLFTVNQALCVSCGICEGICPKNCISMVRSKGMFFPTLGRDCIHCGLCFKACPGKGVIEKVEDNLSICDVVGSYKFLINAWSKNSEIRHHSASGGVTTTLIHQLLEEHVYDTAFVVKEFSYKDYVNTEPVHYGVEVVNFEDDSCLTTKSRYVPISHSNAVKYLIQNPEKKVILVGSSCAINGLLNVIKLKNLQRKNYLLIGLFCESIMNYNVWNYFSSKKFSGNRVLSALHFKNKESGGWPGNMKLLFTDGSHEYYDKSFRMEIKTYFKPERCLYCVDKLNVNADISLGDNYTGIDDSELGSNTVIIRTQTGMDTWNICKSKLEIRSIDIHSIIHSQFLEQRMHNIDFAEYKQDTIKKNTGINLDINSFRKRGTGNMNMKEYTCAMNNIQIGGGTASRYLIVA